MNLNAISRPSLIVDKSKVIKNIRSMKLKAEKSNTNFRPHFKTHQSDVVAGWFREEGISKITVSSVSMAKYFALHGWKDITLAFPFNMREFSDIENLAKSLQMNILISSENHSDFLSKNNKYSIGVFIKIDVGYHRSGLQISEIQTISKIIKELKTNKNIRFKGFLSHFGNTYHTKDKDEIINIYQSGIYILNQLKEKFIQNFPELIISIGDTPSCSLMEKFESVDEIRPGNFVYYDLTQHCLGSCTEEQIAVAVACPVIDKYKLRNEILIYGGAVHFSKDYIVDNLNNTSFGSIVNLSINGWSESIPGAYLKKISQEHGIISIDANSFRDIKIGELIGILPVHSCLCANLLKDIVILE
jgi:D-serine deaminase-like pyridoxal phosphate-dependent protein